ncbi:hypothetical protein [Streptomyces sp. H27-D2]|uniref:hypothetical protein n=1 Tax=Streptomyces sp. H27-D2 TaxID=3046304 RepID=UPI002DBA8D10|nr:hypothetical protein [Streptomyces sp. H27-D2]MEC4015636.1 hypothetical protein [Streptomyces sp. H27-D2]
MVFPRNTDEITAAEYLDSARQMAISGRDFLAHLLAEEAASRTPDPVVATAIRARFPDPNATRED